MKKEKIKFDRKFLGKLDNFIDKDEKNQRR